MYFSNYKKKCSIIIIINNERAAQEEAKSKFTSAYILTGNTIKRLKFIKKPKLIELGELWPSKNTETSMDKEKRVKKQKDLKEGKSKRFVLCRLELIRSKKRPEI